MGLRALERAVARLRWSLARWPRRPELDAPAEPSTAWSRFRRGGGLTGRIHDAFRVRFTPAGRVAAILWFAALVASRVPGDSVGDTVFWLLSAALLVAWVGTWRPVGLDASWRAPDTIEEGGRGEVVVRVRHPGRGRVADPGATILRFGDGLDASADGVLLPSLGPGESAELRLPFLARWRGPSVLVAPRLIRPEPLGLLRSARALPGEAVVAVTPRRPRVARLDFLVQGPDGPAFAAALGRSLARTGDPAGVREYRPGDPLRDLHHRTWARRGVPAVRERSAPRGDGIRLDVRLRPGSGADKAALDALLSLACGVAAWLEERGALSAAFLEGEPASGGLGSPAEGLLQACARVPRPGWGAWKPPRGPSLPSGDGPVLLLGFAVAEPLPLPRGSRALLLDWMTETVATDPAGRTVRMSPLLALAPEISL